ncbi:MAG TPA: GDSL-type esterase/lipase family protein, partial [Propionibacteriaceae bacterium]
TTSDLLDDLEHDRRTRTAVRAADVVVVTIGANDLAPALETWRSSDCPAGCYTPQVAAMGRRLGQVVAAVDAVHPGHHPTVLVTNYWNVFRDGDVGRRAEDDGYLDWSDAVTRVADAAICRSASLGGARCVDLYTPFKGDGSGDPTSYLADDGDHPNAAGTALISRTVLAALDR